MALSNLQIVNLYNSNDEYIDMHTPLDIIPDTAYFIPTVNSWDGLATISVADDVFETDNTDFRSQLGKIQYAPRIFTIHGTIRVLERSVDATEDDLYEARSVLLQHLQHLLAVKDGGLRLIFTHRMEEETGLTLYCHLHGAEALKVFKTPEYYDVTISLIAEDPLIYRNPITVTVDEDGVTNWSDTDEFAKIEILVPPGKSISQYTCIHYQGTVTISQTVAFRTPITSNVTIYVDYPNQICSIDGTDIDNIDVSGGKSAFIKLPRGTSYWNATGTGGATATLKITYRQPLLGIPP